MPMHVRICRDCGAEYRPEILRCADCGSAALEDRYEDDAGSQWSPRPPRAVPPPPPADPPDDAPILGADYAWDLTGLADRLVEIGIGVRVRPRMSSEGHSHGFELRVRATDRERALEELSAFLARTGAAAPPEAGEAEFDPETGYRRCPACSSELLPGASECPACGLAVGPPSCPRCARPMGPEDKECRFCGLRPPE